MYIYVHVRVFILPTHLVEEQMTVNPILYLMVSGFTIKKYFKKYAGVLSDKSGLFA